YLSFCYNMNMQIHIRLAEKTDLFQYTNLLQKTYEKAYVNEALGLTKECFSKAVFNSENTQDYLKSRLKITEKQKTWLVLIEEKLVGSITYISTDKNQGELAGFYVDPDYQGQGIGKKLYSYFMKHISIGNLVLDLYCHNIKAIEIYKRWGWKIDISRGQKGYFYRHWPEWPENLQAKCMYMRLDR
ncbi:MAG: hypothetical protein UR87_C0026G0001, partial [candidate division CPR3 bacterium GW2011_GWE2_35_7]